MNLPQFVHLAPRSVGEACALLSRYQQEARVLAGGTDLLVQMKHRRVVPRYVINIKRIPDLGYIRHDDEEGLRIGALTTVEELKGSLLVRKKYPLLHQAVSVMGTVEVRNRATLAGNVCNASPSAESIPVLMALGARVRAITEGGERIVSVEDLFGADGRPILGADELVTEIQVPVPAPRSGGAYEKHSLRRMDRAVVAVAALAILDGEACRDIRILLNAVGPIAMRARRAEEVLRGQAPDDALVEKASWTAAEESRPRTGLHGSAEFKRNSVGLLARGVIKQALKEGRLGVS